MPISLRVQAVADEASFDRTAERAEKRFGAAGQESGKAFAKGLDDAIAKADPKAVDKWTSAYDRLRDATGKVRVEQAKLDDLRTRGASEARMVAQAEALERARRAEVRATKSATDAYNDLSASGNRLLGTLSSLSAGTRLGGVIGDAEALAGRFGGVGLAVGGATVAVAGLAIGIGAAGSKLYELGAMWDDVADSITARTGKVGVELDAMMDGVSRVALDSSSSIANIGNVMAGVTQSLGATGGQAEDLTAYISDLNDMTGEQTNIKQLGMLYRVFGVETEQQIPMLNQLYTAFTKTQTPVNELMGMLVKAGPVFQQFGFSAGQAVSMLSTFNDAGVDPEKALTGLQKGLKAAADAGKEPKQVLSEVISKIKEFHDAKNDTAAAALAEDFFGLKSAPAFLEAVESGKLSVNQLNSSINQQAKDIRDTRAATDDFAQEWQRFKNFLEVDLQPTAAKVFGFINDSLGSFVRDLKGAIDDLKSAYDWVQSFLPGVYNAGPSSSVGMTPDSIAGITAPGDNGTGVLGPRSPLDVLAPGLSGTTARGTPGRGFPMPWRLPALTPSGRYVGATEMMSGDPKVADLTQGLGDCSSAVEDLVNLMDGQPTAGRSLSTANADEWLRSRGFVAGSMPGAFNVGFNDHHMQATMPDGTPFNWGSDSAAAARGQDGGMGAFDPSLTSHYYRPAPGSIRSVTGSPAPGTGGYYASDPKGIRSAQERIGDIQDNITKADQRIADVKKSIGDANDRILEAQQAQLEAIQKAAEIQADTTATEDQKRSAERQVKSANDAVMRATEARDRIVNRDLPDAQDARDRLQNRDLRDANEALADAQRGTFTSARSGSSRSAGGWGAPIANDFGLSGGLPGLAENVTNLLGNMAFAPAFGALSAVSAAGDPTGAYQGAGGLIGMMAAGSGIGGPLGGGPTTVGGIAPTAGTGGAGFGGIGGLPMAGLQAAAASLDAIAPGASIAANMGIQLANRSIAQIGKDVGIGVGGLMETFAMPGADPGQSWFGRIAAGLAGAKPALPNMAGGSAAAPNNGQAHGTGNGAAPGPGIDVTYNNYQATEDRAGKDLTNHLTAMYAGPGR